MFPHSYKKAVKMAFFNLVNGNVSGNVGQLNGVTDHGKNIVRKKRVTKMHPSATQTAAFSSFSYLHRLCAALRKTLAVELLPSSKKIDRIPDFVTLWKNWIYDKTFPPDGLSRVYQSRIEWQIKNASYSQKNNRATWQVILPENYIIDTRQKVAFIIFDTKGYNYFYTLRTLQSTIINIGTEIVSVNDVYIAGLLIWTDGKIKKIDSPYTVRMPCTD